MADYIGSLNGRLNGEKTLEKKNEIYVKKLEVAICDLKHAFSILCIQVFKGGALRRRGGGRPSVAGLKTGGNLPLLHLKMNLKMSTKMSLQRAP